MRLLSTLCAAALYCQAAHGQPSAPELIGGFRKTIGADRAVTTVPYQISYQGERYAYSLEGGKLQADVYEFKSKLFGYTDKHQHRKEVEMKIGIVPLRIVSVHSGNSGWYQINDGEVVLVSDEAVKGVAQREFHIEVFLGRESFDPKVWQFTEPTSTRVRGQDAWKLEARAGSADPIGLTFSKESGLLVRMTAKATDFTLLPGKSTKLESFVRDLHFANWKKYGNRMLPGQLQIYHDGVLSQQMESVGLSFLDTIDPKLFVPPLLKN